MTTEAWPLPTQIISQQFPNARNATDIGAGARTGPIPVPPTPQPGKSSPQHPQPYHHQPQQRPSRRSQLIILGLWLAGPALIAWGVLPAVVSWQLWQADFVKAAIGGVVLYAQWVNYRQLVRVPARPKAVLIGMAMLLAVGLTSPEMFAPVDDAISGGIEQAMNDDAPPAEVAADPAPPQPEGGE